MKLITLLLMALLLTPAIADTYVNPYTRSDGSYVQGHMRSDPDGNPYNNYSTRGNTNPYTGERGTVSPYGSGSSYGNGSNSGYGNGQSGYGGYGGYQGYGR